MIREYNQPKYMEFTLLMQKKDRYETIMLIVILNKNDA